MSPAPSLHAPSLHAPSLHAPSLHAPSLHKARSAPAARSTEARVSRSVPVHVPEGGEPGTAELPGSVFDVPVNVPLIHQVVVAQLAAARAGTHDTKTRGEVRGGGRKPYRQKGTGRARQGSLRAPQFAGGGIVHGPTPRNYSQRTPKKMKAAALHCALSDRARNNRVYVVSSFLEGETPSTKAALAALAKVTDSPRVLVVASYRDEAVTWKSLRNVPTVHLLDPGQLNAYDVLVSDDVVFTEDALAAFLARTTTTTDTVSAADTALVADTALAGDEVPADEVPADKVPADKVPADDVDEVPADEVDEVPADAAPAATAADAVAEAGEEENQ